GNRPTLAARADDLRLRHPYVGEENLVELGLARHGSEWSHLDAGRSHREEQVADAEVLRGVGLGTDETENHVGVMRRGRPDLLAVDDEVVAVLDRRGAERGQVRARLWLRIALAPDDLAAQRRGDPAALLLFGAELEQRRRQHRDALVRQAGWQAGVGELLGDDARREDVGLGAVSTVFAWNG